MLYCGVNWEAGLGGAYAPEDKVGV
jgi:hypothetical protein